MDKNTRNPYSAKSSVRHFVFFLLAGCLICGVLQRWIGLERTPEYDELYTLNLFVSQSYERIFRDVATPNNHTLNTWGIKFFLPFLQGREVLALRLGAFLAGVGGLLLALYTYLKIPPFRKSLAGGSFVALFAFNGALLHYGSTGRGYSLQSFFVLGAALLLLYLLKRRLSSAQRIAGGILFLFCGAGAVLSVSTGILFMTGLGLGGVFLLFFQYKKGREDWKTFLLQRKYLWTTGVVFAVLSLSYYIPLAEEFMKGTGFGGKLDFSAATLQKIWVVILKNDLIIPLLFTVLSLIAARKNWKIMGFFLIAGVFPFLSGFIFRAGPSRVYVPSISLFLAAGALGAAALMGKWRKKPLFMGIVPILLAMALFHTAPRILEKLRGDDLGVTYSLIQKEAPRNLYPIFMPTESLALEMLYGSAPLKEFLARSGNMEGILIVGRGIGATSLKDGSTEVFPIQEKIRHSEEYTFGGKQKWNHFPLVKPEKEPREYDLIFIWGKDIPLASLPTLTGKEYRVNFRQTLLNGGEGAGFLLLIPGKDLPLPLSRLRQMEEQSRSRVKFLVLKGS